MIRSCYFTFNPLKIFKSPKWTLSALLMILPLTGNSAGNACSEVWHNPVPVAEQVHDQLNLPTLATLFKPDYLPWKARRLKRQVDHKDVHLLQQSYLIGSQHAPVEMGIAELLDQNGQVLDEMIVTGVHRSVYGLGAASLKLLSRNLFQLDKIKTIRRRHTHPQDSSHGIIPHAFSEADMQGDLELRRGLNRLGYTGIQIESWIIYLRTLHVSSVAEIGLGQVSTRGYLVEDK